MKNPQILHPFNPSTRIPFSVRGSGLVTLKVYDVLGREVVTLVNEVKQPGRYEVTFDASGLASGVYFYRLFAVPTGAHSGPPSVLMQQRKMAVLR